MNRESQGGAVDPRVPIPASTVGREDTAFHGAGLLVGVAVDEVGVVGLDHGGGHRGRGVHFVGHCLYGGYRGRLDYDWLGLDVGFLGLDHDGFFVEVVIVCWCRGRGLGSCFGGFFIRD